jgi:hypothetical protein
MNACTCFDSRSCILCANQISHARRRDAHKAHTRPMHAHTPTHVPLLCAAQGAGHGVRRLRNLPRHALRPGTLPNVAAENRGFGVCPHKQVMAADFACNAACHVAYAAAEPSRPARDVAHFLGSKVQHRERRGAQGGGAPDRLQGAAVRGCDGQRGEITAFGTRAVNSDIVPPPCEGCLKERRHRMGYLPVLDRCKQHVAKKGSTHHASNARTLSYKCIPA